MNRPPLAIKHQSLPLTSPGSLFLVSTPIGNLEDITLRALRVLQEVSLIAAEDTRHTHRLLEHFKINTRTVSYHDHSPLSRELFLLEELRAGRNIALVSDAGTPGISDPGYKLVTAAIREGISVVSIPGSSAILAALCSSGLPTNSFVFEGFLPRRRSVRQAAIARLRTETRTTVLFEAPHRLRKTLAELESALGPRPIAVARELTKLFEEIWRGDLHSALERWNGEVRGEIVLVLGGSPSLPDTLLDRELSSSVGDNKLSKKDPSSPANSTITSDSPCQGIDSDDDHPGQGSSSGCQAELLSVLADLVKNGMSRRDAARKVAQDRGLPYRELYRKSIDLQDDD